MIAMKGKILVLLIALVFALPSFAQKNGDKAKGKEQQRKEMMEFKLNFLSEEIGLKENQKKQFDELYTQMEAERRAIFKKIKKAEKSISENKNASEADYEKANQEITDARAEMAKIEKKYDEKFATFLTKKQMYQLHQAEEKFMQRLRDMHSLKKCGPEGGKQGKR